jgi:hypothetical protein
MERRMTYAGSLAALVYVALIGAAWAPPAWAGGGESFGSDEQEEAGHPYFGWVKDRDGNAIPDAKLTVEIKAGTVILRANDEGHFHVAGFGASVNPDDVKFSCSKDGYKLFAATKQVTSDKPNASVEVDCIMAKQ